MGSRIGQYSAFSHLTAAKAAEYRIVLDHFARARTEFVIHLRPDELVRATGLPGDAIDDLLTQLSEWGNLDRHLDHIDATSIEDFNRSRYLYQLSDRGEAAERALVTFEESLQQPGELQTEALRDIITYLESLAAMLPESGERDYPKLLAQFRILNGRFEEFTVQAQRFMQFLQSTIDLHGLSEEDFIAYKDRLIDYLQRFVNELVTSTSEIGERCAALERAGIREVFPGVARQSRADALDRDDPEALKVERGRFEGRWDGLRRWFIGTADAQSQAETLRTRAREAIPSLLTALANFHDRRETGSDRQRDWRTLARWFAETESDAEAHRLWRVAFGMAPARHLRINEETLDFREQSGETGKTSWLDAEPMWLSPRLRRTGRSTRSGRAPDIIDFSAEREALRREAERENAQILRAREQLATGDRMFLADFEVLDPSSFDLLLDLLGQAMTEKGNRTGPSDPGDAVVATSTDGSLTIELWEARSGDLTLANIETTRGVLTGPNFEVRIRSLQEVQSFARAS